MYADKLTKFLEEGLYKAGTISVHRRVHVDVICPWKIQKIENTEIK